MRHILLSTFVLPAVLVAGAAIAATNTSDRPISPPPHAIKALAAVVGADGTLIRGHLGASATHVTTGEYIAHLSSKNISGCVFTATLGTTGSSGVVPPGFINVAGAAADAGGVYVETFDSTGNLVDSSFHVVASC